MTYNDPEKRRAYQREYYHKKLTPGGEKYDQQRAYQREYYRVNLGVDGEKHEQHLERNRRYRGERYAPGGEKHEQALERNRAYYREKLGVGGEKHERYNEKHRKYNGTYQKRERYKVGKRKRDNAWYQREKESILEKRRQKQQPIIAWYKQYKTTIHCIRCGENDPACLHLHHRNRADKKSNVASYVFAASSLERFIDELNKCDVLCANCHAIEHWRENDKIRDIEEQCVMLQNRLHDGTDLGWLKRRRIRNRLRQLETTLWFFRYKYTLRCQHCGMDHPGCIQFHHRDKGEKKAEVSNLRQTSIKQLLHEIDKCDVLCANCHAKLHWKEHCEHDVDDL
jgi:hypothetical protein